MSVDKKVLNDLMLILTQLTETSSEEGEGFQEKKGRGRPRRKGDGSKAREGSSSALSNALANIKVDGNDINSVLQALLAIMAAHVEDQKAVKKEQERRMDEIEERVREQGDYLDEIHQRGMKGNLMISSPTNGGKTSLIKSPEELEAAGVSVTDHVRELIKAKYDVELPAEDIQACHHVPSWPKGRRGKPEYRSIVLRIWNRRAGSAWSVLIGKIMSGGNRATNVYANFQLTKRRSDLVYNLRKLKEAKKISKFYTNENGQVCYRISENSNKVKVTFFSAKKDSNPSTLSVAELLDTFK